MHKQRTTSEISGGIFLISLGILIITDWWWPGIMFAIGLSAGAELIFRGKVARGIGALVFFSAIPMVVWIFQEVKICSARDFPCGGVGNFKNSRGTL